MDTLLSTASAEQPGGPSGYWEGGEHSKWARAEDNQGGGQSPGRLYGRAVLWPGSLPSAMPKRSRLLPQSQVKQRSFARPSIGDPRGAHELLISDHSWVTFYVLLLQNVIILEDAV